MDSISPDTTTTPDDSQLARGRARMRELVAEAEAERRQEAAALVAALGHEPSAIERTVIEQIAARVVRGRRLRQQGKDDTEQSRLVAQLLRSVGMKPQAPQKATPQSLQDWWQTANAEGGQP